MPIPPDRGTAHDDPPLEPVRVLRPRNTDALAELMREYQRDNGVYETVPLPAPRPGTEPATEELPRVAGGRPAPPGNRGRVPGPRRAVVVAAVTVAAVIGFGCALFLPGRNADTAAPAPSAPQDTSAPQDPSAPPAASAAPTPTVSSGTDPDGAGTLREGANGPEVSDLQNRLLRIPNVYDNGPTSGSYDAVLTEAVARFQLWYGIRGDETGVYGDDTRQALESRTGGVGGG
ncbi:peptidoglycan-binding domain-containing protein [Streptomyces sp. YU58]|uniref:peptidoglycan-binding domain-containing protein n=1 Tax=Streptomyces sp. SX92 TaxID=3158972 RepID=UPI0027BAC332|nr:peptidoglycan-binding domain-containing protein [Streptomyces coralus]WLW49894.1 peptidoglycan-binding domain-containing protein [Streptomyces coralus]